MECFQNNMQMCQEIGNPGAKDNAGQKPNNCVTVENAQPQNGDACIENGKDSQPVNFDSPNEPIVKSHLVANNEDNTKIYMMSDLVN